MDSTVSSKKVSDHLMNEIRSALASINGWGSVEIYIQDYKVVQITERNIRKTSHIHKKTISQSKNGVLTK